MVCHGKPNGMTARMLVEGMMGETCNGSALVDIQEV
jgi:hypothetical protein